VHLLLLPLAHGGPGATWQAMLTLFAAGLAVVFLLAVFKVIPMEEPGDLILPFAGTAVLASLSGATNEVLSDWIGWGLPIFAVALIAIVLATTTPLELSPTSSLTIATVAVAIVSTVLLHDPLVRALHPPPDFVLAAELDDLAVSVAAPEDGATVQVGSLEVVVEVTGGSLGPGFADAPLDPDPEELVGLTLTVVSLSTGQSVSVSGVPAEGCQAGCQTATYLVEIPAAGNWSVFVEAKTSDARPFTRGTASTGRAAANVTVTAE
jgi:hypothetical protein